MMCIALEEELESAILKTNWMKIVQLRDEEMMSTEIQETEVQVRAFLESSNVCDG